MTLIHFLVVIPLVKAEKMKMYFKKLSSQKTQLCLTYLVLSDSKGVKPGFHPEMWAAVGPSPRIYTSFYIRHDLLLTKSVQILPLAQFIMRSWIIILGLTFPPQVFLKSRFCVYAGAVMQWECLVNSLFNLQCSSSCFITVELLWLKWLFLRD